MLQRVSNDLDEPVSIFLHSGQLYYCVGAHHDRALEQLSIITRSEGAMKPGVETTQAFIFDPDYVKGISKGQDNNGWIVVELERAISSENKTEETSGPAFGLSRISWTKITRGVWKASEEKEWKHTLDVLRRNHDEKLVVTPSHEEVIEHLERSQAALRAPAAFDFALHSSESSDRPKKRKVSNAVIRWENSDEENKKVLSDEWDIAADDITIVIGETGTCFYCKEPVRRTYRSTLSGDVLGVVERGGGCCADVKKNIVVPCHQGPQSSTADPCTAVQSEAGAHQSSPLLE